MSIGEIEGVNPGASFADRKEMYAFKVHRALQAGIVGRGTDGAESIVLSGGYIDDEDHGSVIIYTGQGGRDQNTGRQVADQELTRGNLALVTSSLRGLPVRVIRGSSHKSSHSPQQGYRYDGLYAVEDYWSERGSDGFLIWRYRLVTDDQRDVATGETNDAENMRGPARRAATTVLRIVRDTALGRRVKSIHDFRCQICGERLECVGGPYAEAAHIKPLGAPHDGPDEITNILCLCPNHHVMLDRGTLTINDELVVQPLGSRLRQKKDHPVSIDHLRYQRKMWEAAEG